MLLFSTILGIKDFVTTDSFINLVLSWNKNSIYAENRIPDIKWHGEHNIRYGNDKLWLEFQESPDKKILAVRHEKITEDGVIWDSDFVVNFAEKQISIRLDRTYSEEALILNGAFSTPHFITLMIENDFIKEDGPLQVLRTPIYVTDKDRGMFEELLSGNCRCKLPVVYVSKTSENKDPMSVSWLASRLKGAAHVLVEESVTSCGNLRSQCGKAKEPFGSARIFFPTGAVRRKKFTYRSADVDAERRLEKVVRSVITYSISQRIDHLYTWQGVSGLILNEQLRNQIEGRMSAESAKRKAEEEIDKIYDTFDDDLKTLQEKVEELTKANEALQYENQGLRAKYSDTETIPILYQGDEDEFYQGEIRDMVLASLDETLAATEKATRKADVLADILDNNPYYHLSEERKQRVKALFKGYKNLTGAMRQELLGLGFEITEAGKHYKITYHGDQRYMVTIGKTPSDARAGKNNAALIGKTML